MQGAVFCTDEVMERETDMPSWTLPSSGKMGNEQGKRHVDRMVFKIECSSSAAKKTKRAGPVGSDRADGFRGARREDSASSRGEPGEPSQE